MLGQQLHAAAIVNGGFEAGLTGWTTAVQTGSEGNFFVQTGTASPVLGSPVPAPPEGANAAMSDAAGPGSRVLYQDFLVGAVSPATALTFALFVNNGAPDFVVHSNLDFATPALNQQARVDLMLPAADPFSVDPADVLLNLFQTNPGDPLVSGYNTYSADVTALLQAHQGQTLRLRFAQVDNVFTFNLGVDDVAIEVVPEPSTWLLASAGVIAGALARRRIRARER
jgi:hypothetical protein